MEACRKKKNGGTAITLSQPQFKADALMREGHHQRKGTKRGKKRGDKRKGTTKDDSKKKNSVN